MTAADAPDRVQWDFGGHPFGLEPFVTRPTTEGLDEWLEATGFGIHAGIRATGSLDQGLPELSPQDDDDLDRLFWFRWVTGHQITFAAWQLLTAALRLSDHGQAVLNRDRLVEEMRLMIRTYSLMLLYTGSCPPDRYGRLIRDPMARQHRYISGSWALDFAPLRSLFRGSRPFSGAGAPRLQEECDLNEHVHLGIAEKLVPDGPSLLQTRSADGGPKLMRRDLLHQLYDCTFLTVRQASIAWDEVVTQLRRRLHAVALDVATNGLEPGPAITGSPVARPDRLATTRVQTCRDRCVDDLHRFLSALGDRETEILTW